MKLANNYDMRLSQKGSLIFNPSKRIKLKSAKLAMEGGVIWKLFRRMDELRKSDEKTWIVLHSGLIAEWSQID